MKVPIPDDWDGVSWCEYGVCWPDSEGWRALLRGFITTPMKGRYWDERSGSILDVTEIGKQIWLDNIPLREVIMSCTQAQEIASAIRYLANKLNSGQCCNGGGPIVLSGSGLGGSGLVQETPSEIDDTGWSGDVPEGFSDWAEWKANKCAAANYLLSQWETDLANAQTINFVGITLLPALLEVLAITLLSPIPGDELIVLAGLLLIAISQGVIEDSLSALHTCLLDRHDDIICALYTSGSVDSVKTAIGTILDDCLSTVAQPDKYIARSMANNWLNNDNLNRLFEKNEEINYPSSDCSECEIIDCLDYVEMLWGTIDSWSRDGDEVTVTFGSVEDPNDSGRQGIHFQIADDQTECAWCMVSEVYSGPGASGLAGWWYRCDNTVLPRGPLPANDGTFCVDETMWRKARVWNTSTSPFTATYVLFSRACV